jgi:hypothetical protein
MRQALTDAATGAVDAVGVEGAATAELYDDKDALLGLHDLVDTHDVGWHTEHMIWILCIICRTVPNLDM